MTLFEMKQQEAKLQAQAALRPYGLELDMRLSSWYYTDNTCTCGVLTTYSKRYPLKGNKALVEQLRADGYTVWVVGNRDRETGARRMELWVEVTAKYNVTETIKKG